MLHTNTDWVRINAVNGRLVKYMMCVDKIGCPAGSMEEREAAVCYLSRKTAKKH